MNQIIVSLIVFCALAVPSLQANTQGGATPEQNSMEGAAEGGKIDIETNAATFSKEFLKSLAEEVHLNTSQQKKIKTVMDKSYEGSKAQWDRKAELEDELQKVGLVLGKEIRSMYEAIRSILSHEQRERFDEIRVGLRSGNELPSFNGSRQARSAGRGGPGRHASR